MLKRSRLPSLLLAISLLLTACQPGGPAAPGGKAVASTSATPTRISVGIVQTLDQPDPYRHSNGFLYTLWCEVLGCLLRYDYAKAEPTPSLAESWKVESPTTWIFNLRKDAKWSDGSAFTSADVVYSMQRILDDPNSLQKYRLAEVTKF